MAETCSKGIGIDYLDCGQGEPAVLFLPGWCASRAKYTELAGRMSSAHRTLALDWRGHGGSERTTADFGEEALVQDALAVVEASGVRQVVPISTAHAGWVAIEMRRRLGARVPKLVLIDWLVLEAPPAFLGALRGIQDATQWQSTRDRMFAMWLEGVEDTRVIRFVRDDMGSYSAAMWARAGREIAAAYMRHGSPLAALAALDPPVPTLHLYAQPTDPAFLQAQETFAAEHSWFQVQKLHAHSHFPSIEVPGQVAPAIDRFLM